jgi:hypothetical protein
MSVVLSALLLPLAIVCTGISFLWLGFSKKEDGTRKSWLPDPPSHERLMKGMPAITWRTAFHWLVNIAVEWVRADPQWWAKFLFFCLVGLIAFRSL